MAGSFLLSPDRAVQLKRFRSYEEFGTVFYSMQMTDGTQEWTVDRRFREFLRCHVQLLERWNREKLPYFPPKERIMAKLFTRREGANQWLEERKVRLFHYTTGLLENPLTAWEMPLMMLLGTPGFSEPVLLDDMFAARACLGAPEVPQNVAEQSCLSDAFKHLPHSPERHLSEDGPLVEVGGHSRARERSIPRHHRLAQSPEAANNSSEIPDAQVASAQAMMFVGGNTVDDEVYSPAERDVQVGPLMSGGRWLPRTTTYRGYADEAQSVSDAFREASPPCLNFGRRGSRRSPTPRGSNHRALTPEGRSKSSTPGQVRNSLSPESRPSKSSTPELGPRKRSSFVVTLPKEPPPSVTGSDEEAKFSIKPQPIPETSTLIDPCRLHEVQPSSQNPRVSADAGNSPDCSHSPRVDGAVKEAAKRVQGQRLNGAEVHTVFTYKGRAAEDYARKVQETQMLAMQRAPNRFEKDDAGVARTVKTHFAMVASSVEDIEDETCRRNRLVEDFDKHREEQRLKQLREEERLVAQWVASVTGHHKADVAANGKCSLQEALASGEALCDLVNAIWPGRIVGIKRIDGQLTEARRLSNLALFVQACRVLGIDEKDIFAPSDLVEGKHLRTVVRCLFALGAISPGPPEFDGPRLGPVLAASAAKEAAAVATLIRRYPGLGSNAGSRAQSPSRALSSVGSRGASPARHVSHSLGDRVV